MESFERLVEEYIDSKGQNHFRRWFESLERSVQARVDARIARVRAGNFGDYKSVGKSVFELRLNFGSGYRVYFGVQGQKLVLLLAGGDKATQSNDIKTAQSLWEEYASGD